jgi:hypothetical protein
MAMPIAVAPADASPYPHHASEDRTDHSEEVFDRDSDPDRGAGDGSLQDDQLMAQSQGLEGDGRCPEEQGAQEGPESGREEHRHPPGTATWFVPRVYALTERWCVSLGQARRAGLLTGTGVGKGSSGGTSRWSF